MLHRLPRPSASQRQKRVFANPSRLCEQPPRHCELYPVIASAAKQSTSQTTRYRTMDCHVAALLAETEARHCEHHPVFANATLSLQTPPRLCEHHPVIASTTPSLRAQRSNPPLRQRGAQPWTATAFGLAETCFNGLPRRYAPRRDRSASWRTPFRLCKRHPVIASAAKQSIFPTTRCYRQYAALEPWTATSLRSSQRRETRDESDITTPQPTTPAPHQSTTANALH